MVDLHIKAAILQHILVAFKCGVYIEVGFSLRQHFNSDILLRNDIYLWIVFYGSIPRIIEIKLNLEDLYYSKWVKKEQPDKLTPIKEAKATCIQWQRAHRPNTEKKAKKRNDGKKEREQRWDDGTQNNLIRPITDEKKINKAPRRKMKYGKCQYCVHYCQKNATEWTAREK